MKITSPNSSKNSTFYPIDIYLFPICCFQETARNLGERRLSAVSLEDREDFLANSQGNPTETGSLKTDGLFLTSCRHGDLG